MKKIFLVVFLLISFSRSDTLIKNLHELDSSQIEKDLKILTKIKKPRNYKNVASLNFVAKYISEEFKKVCDSVAFQTFTVDKEEYKNVIGSIGVNRSKRIVIGAHYDVFENSEGADDNASGVAGLLELARLLSKEELKYRIDFVAYTLEEPPFFRTTKMGSYVHAKYLDDNDIDIKGMICLESIGYFNEESNSQNYPMNKMSSIYGAKGNFIMVVQNEKKEKFSSQISNLMIKQGLIETKSFIGSSLLLGVDFSDHFNYWNFNFDAVMITNTAFYRNKNYHTKEDVLKTLDLKKLNQVIEQLYKTIISL